MKNRNSFLFFVFILLLNTGESASLSSFRVLTWNMGSGYCHNGEIYPDCDSYMINTSVNKMIEVGKDYEIICVQEYPKYYRSQQKAAADKFVEFALKNKFSILRKPDSDIAILSKFPIEEMGEINLSSHYGAQRIRFTLGGKRYQVANIHSAWDGIISDLNTRKEDIRKTVRWMNEQANRGDINILAGDFNIRNYQDIDDAITSVNAFDFKGLPARACIFVDCIYAWGESEWSFVYVQMSSEDHNRAVSYTRNLGGNYSYASNRAVTIQGTNSYLAVNGKVIGDSWQWAFFSSMSYLQENPKYPYKFIIEEPTPGSLRISCPFDGVSYLALNNPLTSSNDYEWAHFGSLAYLRSSSRYQDDPRYFYNKTNYDLKSGYGSYASYLIPNRPVTSWERAAFATQAYINDNPTRYPKTIYIKDL